MTAATETVESPSALPARPGPVEVTRAVLASAVRTAALLAGRRLAQPRDRLGSRLRFADGSVALVYRETVLRAPTRDPALLVVRFRLRLLGHSRVLHRLFRVESLCNTPMFAGFPGFRTKLWACDRRTGGYRGVYEWDGAEAAVAYAERLTTVLAPWCVPGSIAYHVEAGLRRDDVLRDPAGAAAGRLPAGTRPWWLLEGPIEPRAVRVV